MPKPYYLENNNAQIAQMLRVNHAGEYAARIIYQTQINNTKQGASRQLLEEMLEQELEHLDFFAQQLRKRRARPTALLPVWHFLSWGLGTSSAIFGDKYMMIATQSVEEVIQQHYDEQIAILKNFDDEELKTTINKFRQDEAHHEQIAIDNIGQLSRLDKLFACLIKAGCKTAISISKKI